MSQMDEILKALMSVPQQAGGLLGAVVDRLGIPSGETKNAQGDVVYPTNALERLMQGSDQNAQTMAAAFMGPGARGAYRGAPDTMMGFPKTGAAKPFSEQNFSHQQPVYVKLKDGQSFMDTIGGLNQSHALERAYRNWPDAQFIVPVP